MKRIVLAIAMLLATAQAGAQLSTGNLQGDGRTGDVVVIKQEETGFERQMELKADGKYAFRRIPVGWYVVNIKRADGTDLKPIKIRVPVGTTVRLPVAVTEAPEASPAETPATDDTDK